MDFGTTLIKRILTLLILSAGIAQGQTLLTVTNARTDVANDPAFTLSGPSGSFRITYTVTAGGTPIDLNDGSTFRLEVWASDGFRTVNITNNPGAEISPSAGQVRFVLPSIGAGQYRVRGVVTPVSGDTNANWNLTHHYLTVTNIGTGATTINITNSVTGATIASGAVQVAVTVTQEQAVASMSLVPLIASNGAIGTQMYPWGEINVVTGRFDTLSISNLNVAGAISAVDTSKVPLVGGNMTGGLTNRTAQGFVGNGANLTNINFALLDAVTNRGASINGSLVTNGAIITIGTGAEGGTIQLYTNQYGAIVYTNKNTQQITLSSTVLPPIQGVNSFWETYETAVTATNYNAGGWTLITSNGYAVLGVATSESVNQVRVFDVRPITTPTQSWWRAAVRMIAYGGVNTATQPYFGLVAGTATNGNYRGPIIAQSSPNGSPTFNNVQQSLSSSLGVAVATGEGSQSASLPAAPSGLSPHFILAGGEWILLMDADGTNTIRTGYARVGAGLPFAPYQVSGITGTPMRTVIGVLGALRAGDGAQGVYYVFDDFRYEEGVRWW